MISNAQFFRDLVLQAVHNMPDCPLFLSGGVDSATLLAASLELGRKPLCVTFTVGDARTPDLTVASSMTRHFKLEHLVVSIPREEKQLLGDIQQVLSITGSTLKTHVQCSHPFLHMAKALQERGHQTALMGMSLDDLWGSGREMSFVLHKKGEEAFREARRKEIQDHTHSDFSVMKVTRHHHVTTRDPFRESSDLIRFMLTLTYREMHKPYTKALAVNAFRSFWDQGKWYRAQDSLQVVSGLKLWHETLLQNPAVNPTGARDLGVVYRRLLNGKPS